MSSNQIKAFAILSVVLFILPLCAFTKYNAAREFTLTDLRFKNAINNAFS